MKDKKQYYTKEAYLGNTEIITFVNGKKEFSDIVSDYNVEGYTECLRTMGYVYGYPVVDIEAKKKRIEELEKELEYAKQDYEDAHNNPIKNN